MGEAQKGGMQFELSGGGSGSVETVADNRCAESVFRGGVDAELMGSSSDWNKFDAGLSVFNTQHLPVGDANFSVDGVIDLNGAVVDVESEG